MKPRCKETTSFCDIITPNDGMKIIIKKTVIQTITIINMELI